MSHTFGESLSPNAFSLSVAKSINGQEASWKNALSRKFIGLEMDPEAADNIIRILLENVQEKTNTKEDSIKSDLRTLVRLFNNTVDRMPFSGKALITPVLKNTFAEKEVVPKEFKLVQALLLMLFMSASHANQAHMGFEGIMESSDRLAPAAISLAYFIANAAVTIRQLELSGRVMRKLTDNSKELANLIMSDDEALVRLILKKAEKGDMGFLKYLVVVKGKQRVSENIGRAYLTLHNLSPDGTYDQGVPELTEDEEEYLFDMLAYMSTSLDREKRSRLRLLITSALDMSHTRGSFTLREIITMIVVTLGGQLAFLGRDSF